MAGESGKASQQRKNPSKGGAAGTRRRNRKGGNGSGNNNDKDNAGGNVQHGNGQSGNGNGNGHGAGAGAAAAAGATFAAAGGTTTPGSRNRIAKSSAHSATPHPNEDEDTTWNMRLAAAAFGCALVAGALYANTVGAAIVWDDRAAVKMNMDLRPTTPWSTLLKHDFWGQEITDEFSHKSFRPVTVASYRLNYAVHEDDPAGYHAVNVLLHALVTALVAILAAVLSRSIPRCVAAGLLFAVHPVHVEAVAGLVGRAEVLSAAFYLFALLAYVKVMDCQHADQRRNWRRYFLGWAFLVLVLINLALAVFSKENGLTVIAAMLMLEFLYRPRSAVGPTQLSISASDDHAAPSTSLQVLRSAATPIRRADGERGDNHDKKHHRDRDDDDDDDEGEVDADAEAEAQDPATLILLAKSTPRAASGTVGSDEDSGVDAHSTSIFSDIAWALNLSLDGAIRLATVGVFTAIIMSYRISVHEGAPLYKWTILENQMSLMPPSAARTLTILYTHALYLKLLLWPKDLAFDWGVATIAPISGWTDPRNAITALAYAAFLYAVYASLRRRSVPALWGLAAAVSSFVPASNVFIWVGTELAERLLYLPTVGLAIAAAVFIPTSIPEAWTSTLESARDSVLAVGVHLSLVSPSSLSTGPARRAGGNLKQKKVRKQASSSSSPSASSTCRRRWNLFVVVIFALSARSFVRNLDWLDEARVYETGIEVCPKSVKALNNLAYLLLDGTDADRDRAEVLLLRAVDLWPGHSTAFFNLAVIQLHRKNSAKAIHYFWKSVGAEYKTPGGVFMHLGEYYLNMFIDAGMSDVPEWAVEAGGDIARDWIAQNVTPDPAHSILISISKRLLEESTRRGHSSAKLSLLRGNLAREVGFLETAVRELTRATEQALQDNLHELAGAAHNLLALAYEQLGDATKADEAYQRSIVLAPGIAHHYSNAANFYAKLGKFELAMRHSDQAVALSPQNPLLINNYGYACELAGRLEDALMAYKQAHQLMPSHVVIKNNVAKIEGMLQERQQQQQQQYQQS